MAILSSGLSTVEDGVINWHEIYNQDFVIVNSKLGNLIIGQMPSNTDLCLTLSTSDGTSKFDILNNLSTSIFSIKSDGEAYIKSVSTDSPLQIDSIQQNETLENVIINLNNIINFFKQFGLFTNATI